MSPTSGKSVSVEKQEKELKFFMASKTAGGEYYLIQRIAKKMGSEISVIWQRGDRKASIEAFGLKNRFIVRLAENIPGGRGLFLNILISRFSFPENVNAFVSTPYYPIPKNTTIAYIHTPSRKMTVEFSQTQKGGMMRKIFWKVFRTFYVHTYCNSLKNSPNVFVNTETVKSRIDGMCGFDTGVKVVYPSSDGSPFRCLEPENYFFMPSRFTEQKNQIFLIKAFTHFMKKYQEQGKPHGEFRLILAGRDPNTSSEETEYVRKLKSFIKEIGGTIEDRVEFIFDADWQKIVDLYSKCYCVLYSGIEEDFGFVPVEAMLACKPVVALGQGGITETIEDGVNGYQVKTPEEMGDKLIYLVDNRKVQHEMGLAGREFALTLDDPGFIRKVGLDKFD